MEQIFSRNSTAPTPNGIPFPEYYPYVMDYRFPLTIASLYVISVSLLNPKSNAVSRIVAKQKGIKATNTKSSPLMTGLVFLHNLALCVFSIITFINMGSAFIMNFKNHRDNFTDAVSYFELICTIIKLSDATYHLTSPLIMYYVYK
jgi:hypothetical protein